MNLLENNNRYKLFSMNYALTFVIKINGLHNEV